MVNVDSWNIFKIINIGSYMLFLIIKIKMKLILNKIEKYKIK